MLLCLLLNLNWIFVLEAIFCLVLSVTGPAAVLKATVGVALTVAQKKASLMLGFGCRLSVSSKIFSESLISLHRFLIVTYGGLPTAYALGGIILFVEMLDGIDLRSLVKCVLLRVRCFWPCHAVHIRFAFKFF